jgi:hypothetical protein
MVKKMEAQEGFSPNVPLALPGPKVRTNCSDAGILPFAVTIVNLHSGETRHSAPPAHHMRLDSRTAPKGSPKNRARH